MLFYYKESIWKLIKILQNFSSLNECPFVYRVIKDQEWDGHNAQLEILFLEGPVHLFLDKSSHINILIAILL